MVKPSEVRINLDVVTNHIKQIDSMLLSGETVATIPINHNLSQIIIEHYSSHWSISTREYKKQIRLTFRPKEENGKIIIEYRDKE